MFVSLFIFHLLFYLVPSKLAVVRVSLRLLQLTLIATLTISFSLFKVFKMCI